MELAKFLEEFQDLLQRDDPIHVDDPLKEMEEWDSMSVMACMAYFDKRFGMKVAYKAFIPLKTVRDIIALAKGNIV